MLLRKLKAVALAVFVLGTATASAGVWVHWPSDTHGKSALASSNQVSAAPSETSGAPALAAEPGGDDCPASGKCGPGDGCPLSMAANAVARVFHHLHGESSTSN